MRIISLLEGTEHLYHYTPGDNISSILGSGGLVMSILMANSSEYRKVEERLGGNPKHIFYFSLARSMHSIYISDAIGSGRQHFAVFEFSGRKLSRLGKIVPFDFFATHNANFDEMEDRLFSDKGFIPFSMVECIHVRCTPSDVKLYEQIIKQTGIRIIFYTSSRNLMLRRGGLSIDELKNNAEFTNGKEIVSWDQFGDEEEEIAKIHPSHEVFLNFINNELDGKEQTYDDFVKLKYWPDSEMMVERMLSRSSTKKFELVHEVLTKLKRKGFDNHTKIWNYLWHVRTKYKNLNPKLREDDDKLLKDLGIDV